MSRGRTGQPPAEPVLGRKYLKVLAGHLKKLRGAYAHGNRVLFYDDLATAYLLAFFNPTCRSLRTIEDLSQTPAARAHLRVARVCRSTASDANALFDPALLEPLVARLRARVPDLSRRDGQLARLLKDVALVDGSFFNAAADVAWAITHRNGRDGVKGPPRPKVRLDLHLDAATFTPRRLAVSGADHSEPGRAASMVEPGVTYVCDRGYVSFELVDAVIGGRADLVLRLTAPTNFVAREHAALDEADRAAGVTADRIGRLGGSPHCKPPRQELREVTVLDPARPDAGPVRLLTTILDLPAHVIAALYRWRWQIELFFRWLKVHANFRHLTSHSAGGMALGFHVAVIAVLLMYQYAGRPVGKYAYSLLSLVAGGMADAADVLPILAARERERETDRRRRAARAAEKTAK
jgi:hypothetical protein